jgi:hypothetical protein
MKHGVAIAAEFFGLFYDPPLLVDGTEQDFILSRVGWVKYVVKGLHDHVLVLWRLIPRVVIRLGLPLTLLWNQLSAAPTTHPSAEPSQESP